MRLSKERPPPLLKQPPPRMAVRGVVTAAAGVDRDAEKGYVAPFEIAPLNRKPRPPCRNQTPRRPPKATRARLPNRKR